MVNISSAHHEGELFSSFSVCLEDNLDENTTYLYDGDNVLIDYVSGASSSTMTFNKLYVTPFLDQNLSMTDASNNTYYYSQDGLGSVRTLTNSSGAKVNRYDYTAFGRKISTTGTTTDTNVVVPNLPTSTSEGVENRYTYTGREVSAFDLAPMYYRYRHYFTGVGRWGARDPIGYYAADEPNIYNYVAASVSVLYDPLGLAGKVYPVWPDVNENYNATVKVNSYITAKKLKLKLKCKCTMVSVEEPDPNAGDSENISVSGVHLVEKPCCEFTRAQPISTEDIGIIANHSSTATATYHAEVFESGIQPMSNPLESVPIPGMPANTIIKKIVKTLGKAIANRIANPPPENGYGEYLVQWHSWDWTAPTESDYTYNDGYSSDNLRKWTGDTSSVCSLENEGAIANLEMIMPDVPLHDVLTDTLETEYNPQSGY